MEKTTIMKRFLSLALSLVVAAVAMAQDTAEPNNATAKHSKDYSEYLPKAGDFSVGFSLNPIATFVGNLFNGNVQNTLGNLAGEPMGTKNMLLPTPDIVSIMGKYMLTDQLAVKANIGFGCYVFSKNGYAMDDAALFENPLSQAKVEDRYKEQKFSGSFALGIDYHVGKRSPVQGVFGAGLLYAVGSESHLYRYGNAITELNQQPSQADVFPVPSAIAFPGIDHPRLLKEQAEHLIHRVGAYASVGIEWFVAPKISLGANVNVDICYVVNPALASVYEGWNKYTETVEEYTNLIAPANHGFTFSTDNIGANLLLNFYF